MQWAIFFSRDGKSIFCPNDLAKDDQRHIYTHTYMFMHRGWQAWVCMVHLIVKVVPFDYFGSRVPQAKIGKGLFCFWWRE